MPERAGERRQQQRVDHQAGRPTTPKRPNLRDDLAQRRGGQSWRRNAAASRDEALVLPAWRSPNWNGTSDTRSPGVRTRISSRILKPCGLQAVEVDRVAPDQEEAAHRVRHVRAGAGNSVSAARDETRDIALRARRNGPTSPPAQNRLATTTSQPPSRAPGRACPRSASGGCCRSASITQTHSPRAVRMPSTTAPPRPPGALGGSRCSRRTGARPTAIPPDRVGRVVVAVVDEDDLERHAGQYLGRAEPRSASTFPASSRVGSTTDTQGVSRAASPFPFWSLGETRRAECQPPPTPWR